MKKSILTLILAVLDIALLLLIVVSAKSAGSVQPAMSATTVEASVAAETSTIPTEAVIPPAETFAVQTQAETAESIAETTTVPETFAIETQADQETQTDQETQADPETTAEETLPAMTDSTGTIPGAENWLTPGMETENLPKDENFRDVSAYDTHELPNIKDFKWVTADVLNGECPAEAEEIYFEESLGGWKCYITDDATEMERLANMELSGTMEALELRFDWYYIRQGGKDGEAYEDNTEDSVFLGYVNDDGEIEAEGPGRIHVTDIYAIGDHMYAFGKLYWPDGIVGYLFLVRP